MAEKLDDSKLEAVAGGAYSGSVFLYTVQPGENLSLLARRFGTTVKVLGELNGILSAGSVQPGMKLLIPLRG